MADDHETIRSLDEDTYVKRLFNVVMFIKDDLGIRGKDEDATMSQYRMTRLADYLQKHFGNLTFREVKEAFDLAISGKLDLKGEDLQHYQRLDLIYVTTILSAYVRYRGQAILKVKNALPTPTSPEYTEEVKRGFLIQGFNELQQRILSGEEVSDFLYGVHFLPLITDHDAVTINFSVLRSAYKKGKSELVKELREKAIERKYEREHIKARIKRYIDGDIPNDDRHRLKYRFHRQVFKIALCAALEGGSPITIQS